MQAISSPTRTRLWLEFLVNIVISLLVSWLILGPIWHLTFVNAGRGLSLLGQWSLVVAVLIPIWFMQAIALAVCPPTQGAKRLLMLISGYLFAIGPVLVLAYQITPSDRISTMSRWFRFGLASIVGCLLFWIFVQFYAIAVVTLLRPILFS